MKGAARFLTREIRYDVSPQDLEIDTGIDPAVSRKAANVRDRLAFAGDFNAAALGQMVKNALFGA